MNTVGVFAGRGDVILAMAFAGAFGVIIGWYLRGLKDAASRKLNGLMASRKMQN